MTAPGGSHPGRVGGEVAARGRGDGSGQASRDRQNGGGGFGQGRNSYPGYRGPTGTRNAAAAPQAAPRGGNPNGSGTPNEKGILSKAFDAAVNPVKEDPVLNGFVKAAPFVGQLASLASLLDAAGVPNTPPNTSPAYQHSQGADIGGQGKSEAGDVIDGMNPMAPPPLQPIGYKTQTIYTSDGNAPKIDKVPIYPKVVKPNAQFPTSPNAPSSRVVG